MKMGLFIKISVYIKIILIFYINLNDGSWGRFNNKI